MSFKTAARYTLRTIQTLCGVAVFTNYVAEIRLSYGPSMVPTFSASPNLVLGECISPRLNPPNLRRGDIITFLKPTQHSVSVCKRILAMPGDTISVDPLGGPGAPRVVIPAGHIWVQGDNPDHSLDSRAYGPVPMGLVKSRVVARA
ncbi:hypothetical protein M407DRAFT_20558, partial [Tulasnella calospora MUT 4182]